MGKITVDRKASLAPSPATNALEQELGRLLKAMRPEFSEITVKTQPGDAMFLDALSTSFYNAGRKMGYAQTTPVLIGEKEAELYIAILSDARFASVRNGIEMVFLHEYGHSDTINENFDRGVRLVLGGKDINAEFSGSELATQQYAMARVGDPADAIASMVVLTMASIISRGDACSNISSQSRLIKHVYREHMAKHWSTVTAETLTRRGKHTIMQVTFKENEAVMENGRITMPVTTMPEEIHFERAPGVRIKPGKGDRVNDTVSIDPSLFVPLGVPKFVPLDKEMEARVFELVKRKWAEVGPALVEYARSRIAADPKAVALLRLGQDKAEKLEEAYLDHIMPGGYDALLRSH